MKTIDIFISKIDKDGLPRRCGMRSLETIFNDLAEKLQNEGLISDLHFTFNKKQMNLSDVTTASFLCYCSYGRNGGIFLDLTSKQTNLISTLLPVKHLMMITHHIFT